MLVTVLKAFLYAHDGFTVRDLTPSETDPPSLEEVRDDLVAGLEAAGYISTGQGVGHVVQQAAVDQTAVDDPNADDRAGPAEGVAEEGARAAGAEARAGLTDWNDPTFVISGLAAMVSTDTGAAAPAAVQPLEIPADWQDLHWTKKVALAKKLLGGEGDLSADEAKEVIADEVKRRDAAKAGE